MCEMKILSDNNGCRHLVVQGKVTEIKWTKELEYDLASMFCLDLESCAMGVISAQIENSSLADDIKPQVTKYIHQHFALLRTL